MDQSLSKLMAKVDINGNERAEDWSTSRKQIEDSWNGLPTEDDRNKSRQFLNTIVFKGAVICPYCQTRELTKTDSHLVCDYCGVRFATNLSINEVIARIEDLLLAHQYSGCVDPIPQLGLFGNKMVLYCDGCPFKNFVL